MRRSRLFNRERSGPSLSSVSSGSVAPSPCSGTSTNAHQQQQTHQQKESCSSSKKSSGAQGNSGCCLTSSTSSSKDKSNESSVSFRCSCVALSARPPADAVLTHPPLSVSMPIPAPSASVAYRSPRFFSFWFFLQNKKYMFLLLV